MTGASSKTLSGPLEWNATLLEGDLADSVTALKDQHSGNLIVTGCGELVHALIAQSLIDGIWFWMNLYPCATGSPILKLWKMPAPIEGLADFALVHSYLSTAAKWGIHKGVALRLQRASWMPQVSNPPITQSATCATSHR